jgi:hypothetical protein
MRFSSTDIWSSVSLIVFSFSPMSCRNSRRQPFTATAIGQLTSTSMSSVAPSAAMA